MRLFTNILSHTEIEEVKKIMEHEITYHRSDNTPGFQSDNDMHQKYADRDWMKKILRRVGSDVWMLWFNVSYPKMREQYGWHTHESVPKNSHSAVYYVDGCDDNGGTCFLINEVYNQTNEVSVILKADVPNNSILLFDGKQKHGVSPPTDTVRYTIAMDLYNRVDSDTDSYYDKG